MKRRWPGPTGPGRGGRTAAAARNAVRALRMRRWLRRSQRRASAARRSRRRARARARSGIRPRCAVIFPGPSRRFAPAASCCGGRRQQPRVVDRRPACAGRGPAAPPVDVGEFCFSVSSLRAILARSAAVAQLTSAQYADDVCEAEVITADGERDDLRMTGDSADLAVVAFFFAIMAVAIEDHFVAARAVASQKVGHRPTHGVATAAARHFRAKARIAVARRALVVVAAALPGGKRVAERDELQLAGPGGGSSSGIRHRSRSASTAEVDVARGTPRRLYRGC